MSVGTGAIKGRWGPWKNTKHSRKDLWKPSERELAQEMHFLSKVLEESRGPQTMCSITECVQYTVHIPLGPLW